MSGSPQPNGSEVNRQYNSIVGYLTGNSLFRKQQPKKIKKSKIFPNSINSDQQAVLYPEDFNYESSSYPNRLTSISDQKYARKRQDIGHPNFHAIELLQRNKSRSRSKSSKQKKSVINSREREDVKKQSPQNRLNALLSRNMNINSGSANRHKRQSNEYEEKSLITSAEKREHQPIYSSYLLNGRSKSPRKPSKHQPLYRNQQQNSIEEDDRFPITSESRLINSRRKYFEQCRVEAEEYLFDLRDNLLVSAESLSKFRDSIHIELEAQIREKKFIIKEDLLTMIEDLTNEWESQQIDLLHKNQIGFLDDLLEVQEQIQERISKLEKYIYKLSQEERGQQHSRKSEEWRQISAHLLVSSEQENAVREIGEICSKMKQTFQQKVFKAQEMLDESNCGIPLDRELHRALNERQLQEIEAKFFEVIGKQAWRSDYKNHQQQKRVRDELLGNQQLRDQERGEARDDSDPEFVARFAKISSELP